MSSGEAERKRPNEWWNLELSFPFDHADCLGVIFQSSRGKKGSEPTLNLIWGGIVGHISPLQSSRKDASISCCCQAVLRLAKDACTVRKPPRPVDWHTDDDVDSAPEISIPSPPSLALAKRIAATTLVNAVADASGDRHSNSQREESVGLSPTTFGTVVHRINELRPPRDDWPALIQRLSRMAGEEPTETDLRDAVDHAADAVEFVDQVEANAELQATYDEYSVVARMGESRIVGDIDRLLVTPDAFHVIDYKTNDLSATTSDELAEHYRPQMLVYALAFLQHDRNRDVRASLRFTDEGIEERFNWESDQMAEIESELRSMMDLIE